MQRANGLTIAAILVFLSCNSAAAAPIAVPSLVPPQLAADLSLAAPSQPVPDIQIAPVAVDDVSGLTDSLPSLANPPAGKTLSIAGLDLPATGGVATVVRGAKRLQCVTFARAMTGLDIFGDARTWWAKARGLYAELTAPKAGAVMVFAGDHRMRLGHVAVVKEVVSAREVRVDHANWGNDGKIYLNAPVVDVSRDNDWSLVRVWNARLHALGSHVYRLRGFVAG